MAKNNFILYKDFDTTLDLLNDEQAGRLFKALYKYVNGRNEPNFKDGMLIVAFNMLKTQLERDLDKYNKRIQANVANGKLGGRPRLKPKEPTGLKKTQHNPMKAKKGDSVSVSVSGSVSDSDKKDIKTSKKFVKPTIINITNYCKEKNLNIEIEKFIDYYESNGWKVGKNPMKDWKATVRNWARNSNGKPKTIIDDNRYGGH